MVEQIGSFRIEGEVGRGGMGVVYRAVDERLDRVVAIKALPEEFAGDPARLARFEREAKTLAALNHANLGQIYGLEEQDGRKYLVLEFIEGETLADRLDRGALPVEDVIEVGIEIANGLEAAHEAGVIHRDLKPANIKITPEGRVKVLDFGLAKADEGASSSSDGFSQRPTIPSSQPQHSPTLAGAILGTAAYMSPEQARGRKLDKRTDIWSFGVVMYEMLVGASPFIGETATDSIGAILHKDLDLERLPRETPAGVKRVISRCVERDKAHRYRDIGDVREELLRAKDEPAEEGDSSTGGVGAVGVVLIALLVVVVGAVAWLGAVATRPGVTKPVIKTNVVTEGEGIDLSRQIAQISPDGRRIAYLVENVIHLRDLKSFESRALTEIEGVESLFWSPDSEWIGYFTRQSIYRVSVTGGGAMKVADTESSLMGARGGGWTLDGRIVYPDDDKGVMSVPVRGGEPSVWAAINEETELDFHHMTVMTGTNVALFVSHMKDGRYIIEAHDGTRRAVIGEVEEGFATRPTYSPSGHVVFGQGVASMTLWGVGFDVERMEVVGGRFLIQTEAVHASFSLDGAMLVQRGSNSLDGVVVVLGKDGSVTELGGGFDSPRFAIMSPDGTKLAVAAGSLLTGDAWVRDLVRGSNNRITFEEMFVIPLAWSEDSQEIAVGLLSMTSPGDSETRFYFADGSGESRDPIRGVLSSFNREFTMAVGILEPMGESEDAWLFDLSNPDEPTVLDIKIGNVNPANSSLSPDGALLAYSSSQSGESEVFLARIAGQSGLWQVSTEGGSSPFWSADGGHLYFTDEDRGVLFGATVETDPTVQIGMPEVVVDYSQVGLTDFPLIRPTADGEGFVAIRADTTKEVPTRLSLVTNWFEEFRER